MTTENDNQIIKSKWDKCPFLSKGKCTVYDARPKICKDYYCWDNKDSLDYRVAVSTQEQGIKVGYVKARESGGVAVVYLVEED